MVQFKIGDVVQVGRLGEKGKIVDVYKPLGSYEMYKVHIFTHGEIRTAAKHELVKGLPDEIFQNVFDYPARELDTLLSQVVHGDGDLLSRHNSAEPNMPIASQTIPCPDPFETAASQTFRYPVQLSLPPVKHSLMLMIIQFLFRMVPSALLRCPLLLVTIERV